MRPRSRTRSDPEPTLSIGALAGATGVPVETLRTWERRYGFPSAGRRPSGHRVYPLSAVARVRRALRLLRLGQRPADVFRLSSAALELLGANLEPEPASVPAEAPPSNRSRVTAESCPRTLITHVRALDGAALAAALEQASHHYPPGVFVEQIVAPLMSAVGGAWARGTLDIRHEHLAAARVAESLRALRRRLERRGPAPQVALALLPGERHELGLLMAAVVFAESGWSVVEVGSEMPPDELVALAREARLDAVAVSVSAAADRRAARAALGAVAAALPAGTPLLIGGHGAPRGLASARTFRHLDELRVWLDRRGPEGTDPAQQP
jgi:DNA-binding transcriptional MerR regulator/methylmalonyl-CoA mutase cobalamin-binding subunit